MTKHKLIDNNDQRRYELQIDGQVAFIDYRKDTKHKRIALVHTEVPKSMRGQGIATTLTKLVLEDIQQQDYKVLPYCPFVAAYIKEHKKWMSLIPEDVSIG